MVGLCKRTRNSAITHTRTTTTTNNSHEYDHAAYDAQMPVAAPMLLANMSWYAQAGMLHGTTRVVRLVGGEKGADVLWKMRLLTCSMRSTTRTCSWAATR